MKKTAFWKGDWFFGLVVAVVLFVASGSDFIQSLERQAYDLGVRASSHVPSQRVAVIAQSIANIGRWPWPREIHAQMINNLKQAEADDALNSDRIGGGDINIFPVPTLRAIALLEEIAAGAAAVGYLNALLDVDGKPAFPLDSFYDVISGKIPAEKYRDKVVLISHVLLTSKRFLSTERGKAKSDLDSCAAQFGTVDVSL